MPAAGKIFHPTSPEKPHMQWPFPKEFLGELVELHVETVKLPECMEVFFAGRWPRRQGIRRRRFPRVVGLALVTNIHRDIAGRKEIGKNTFQNCEARFHLLRKAYERIEIM